MNDDRFIYACQWRDTFYPLEKDNIELYYYSFYYDNSPVYKLVDHRLRNDFDVYRYNNRWMIKDRFNHRRTLDFSNISNQLNPLIPPKYGWQSQYFKELMELIIGEYHVKLRPILKDFDYWNVKDHKNLNKKKRDFVLNFILVIKKFEFKKNIPLEMVWMILGHIKNVEL